MYFCKIEDCAYGEINDEALITVIPGWVCSSNSVIFYLYRSSNAFVPVFVKQTLNNMIKLAARM